MEELPYFKFFVNKWITGDICFEDMETQGFFISLCAFYWSKGCSLSLKNAKRKFTEIKPSAFQSLIDNKIIKIDAKNNIKISFLDDQKNEFTNRRKINSSNGKKGGRPRKELKYSELQESEKKPNGFNLESESKAKHKAKKSNIDKIREDKNIYSKNPPSIVEFEQYFIENGFSKSLAAKAHRHYDLAGWKDTNGKPVLSWKQKVNTVWFKDENRIKEGSNRWI